MGRPQVGEVFEINKNILIINVIYNNNENITNNKINNNVINACKNVSKTK